jgi:exopolyphosphatase / guanosine-5'-triphosphate,3'-diphosphate pyrophosphatase
MQNGTRLAAVDLGSNSFRLEIGRLDHGQIHRTEYLKETVRQGSGLDADRNLTADAMQRGWDCLARFGERLAGFKPTEVRAVATQTLREARNSHVFLSRACEVLGFPIDVISGHEEARLIYQGVARMLPQSGERRLVVDIGGRSTELILGQHLAANVMASYRVGSVAWSMKYFPHGQLTTAAFNRAEIAAKAVLEEAMNTYRQETWDVAYGSSGTMGAVADILTAAGWPAATVTRDGLEWLVDKLIKAQHCDRVRLVGLKEDRRAVIGGGVSVLRAVFDLLSIDHLYPAQGALRHGALYDLLDRENGQSDLRTSSVQRLANNFGVDFLQAERVANIADTLFAKLQTSMHINSSETIQTVKNIKWAAQLHELGCQISHSEYHKHGAYILDNADMSGFDLPELHRLSLLVLGHRGKLKKLDAELENIAFMHQLLVLRLAVILCHARRDIDIKGLQLEATDGLGRQFVLTCPSGWARLSPQSAHLLREEALAWQKVNWSLALQGCDCPT